jgi:RNA polymerase sigma-70 factor (ECF subfamily)
MNVDPADVQRLIRFATKRTGTAVFDEDLTQEACLRALDASRRVGKVDYPRAFLMKIVLDTVRDHWRRKRPTENLDDLDERFIGFTPALDLLIDRKRKLCRLHRALRQLDPAKRHTIHLFYLEGLPVREIAGFQQRTVSAVKMDLLRGRKKLAELMAGDNFIATQNSAVSAITKSRKPGPSSTSEHSAR